MTGTGDLHELVRVTANYLRAYEPAEEFVEVLDGFDPDQFNLDKYRAHVRNPVDPPDLRHAASDSEPQREALHSVLLRLSGWLRWQQNPTYTDTEFLRRYAYTELVGPGGVVEHDEVLVGFLCLAPNTYYPPHAHPAEEIYHLIAGPSHWQQCNATGSLQEAGARIVHPSGVAHSMRSGDQPMLALYLWRGDLATPARLTT